jgi:hypothetical protein
MQNSADLERNIALHLGGVRRFDPSGGEVRVLTPSSAPSAPLRAAQRLAMKLGRLDWESAWLEKLLALRRSVLGEGASGPPRFLVRVDEFPYYTSFDHPEDIDMSRKFHDVMAAAGLAHLMSVVPQLTHAPLTVGSSGGRPLGGEEIELLNRMRGDRVTFAQHGTTHRTLFESPRRRSEFSGLSSESLERVLEDGRGRLLEAGLQPPRVFVPPFNRFDAAQYPVLASRFDVVCGGPESVAMMGFHGGPLWREGAVYLPAYAPLYSNARAILPVAERLIDLAPGTWIPIVLHTSWEQEDDFRSLERLADRIAPFTEDWDDFLAEVARSAGGSPAPAAGASIS